MKTVRKRVSLLLAGTITCMLLAGCGGGSGSDAGTATDPVMDKSALEQLHSSDKNRITCGLCGVPIHFPFVSPTLEWFAGDVYNSGSANSSETAASFYNPRGIATDSAGNVYVADAYNYTIRKITPFGVVSTLAGTAGVFGNADGTGAAATFNTPTGIAVDGAGNVYVADSGNNDIRKITPAGVVTTLAGTAGVSGSADGIGAAASFHGPNDVATDSAGNVYVADVYNSTIRKVTPSGVVSTLAGTAGVTGSANGTGATARFNQPFGVATDSAGNVYVADTFNYTIRKITPSGVVTTLAGTAGLTGSTDGTGAAASFNTPTGIATDDADNVYVVDTLNSNIRKITSAGVVSTLAGTAGVVGSFNGTGATASFSDPYGTAIDSAGNVYLADSGNDTIRKVTPIGAVSTLAGTTGVPGSADSIATTASFTYPRGTATDNAGNVYVADYGDSTIRKITPAGWVTTLAGTANVIGSLNGTGAAASFTFPSDVATDSVGNVYVADTGNNLIRKITPTGVVTTLAGSADLKGSSDGTGTAAKFNAPRGIATDSANNVYVADTGNETIRKITPAGVVTTLAGTAGIIGSVNGTGPAARFSYVSGIAADSAGNVYVADTANSNIRMITPAGVVTTLAGTANVIGSADGIGTAASFSYPFGVATDSANNVYVADYGNSTIRLITPAGVVSTLVGVAGQSGFIAGALPGGLVDPYGVAFSGSSLYVTTGQGVAVVNNL